MLKKFNYKYLLRKSLFKLYDNTFRRHNIIRGVFEERTA